LAGDFTHVLSFVLLLLRLKAIKSAAGNAAGPRSGVAVADAPLQESR
jgi:hypothetical protein